MRRRFSIKQFGMMIATVCSLTLFSPFSVFANTSVDTVELQTMTQQLVADINTVRSQNGLVALSVKPELQDAALLRSSEIMANFSNVRPDGTEWYTVSPDFVYGENIAMIYALPDASGVSSDVPAATLANWLAEPTYRTNILSSSFSYLNTAISENNGYAYVVVEFG